MRDLSDKSSGTKDDANSANATDGNGLSRVWMMVSRQRFEHTATSIAALGRNELKRRIRNFRGRFKLDFTDSYLNKLSVDRLRHILLAALINAKR